MRAFFKILVISISIITAVGIYGVTPKRDADKIKKEQQATKREIAETSKKITANTKETNRMLAKLNSLSAEAKEKKIEVDRLQNSVDSIDLIISALNDSISSMDRDVEKMRIDYAKSLKTMQGHFHNMSTLSFIFSSSSFSKAWQRIRYIRELSKWRGRRANEIKASAEALTQRCLRLDSMQANRRVSVARLSLSQKQLEEQKNQTDKLVGQLKKEGSSLKTLLREKEKKARALDNELEKLIIEEQKRAERERLAAEKKRKEEDAKKLAANKSKSSGSSESPSDAKTPSSEASVIIAEANRALTGGFESNKGKLLFPVSGKYRIVRGFGRQKHPELEHVETDNSGIDIEAVGGGTARAVFNGKVSEIFKQPGYNTIVMVRHGNYLTIYANLASINVKKGDDLTAGQTIGTIYADPEEDGASILHFELRKERTKLNPMEWVK